MIFRQILNDDLSCASYVLADEREAVVVDPAWEIEPYLALARSHRFVIRHVLDTHVHADHVSGRNRLVAATGATAYLPPRTDVSAPHRLLRAGGTVRVGAVRIETLPTPGHRPEHVSFLVTDSARSEEPCLLLSGDSLLIGDVARPDLAVDGDEVSEAARTLFHSLRRLSNLPDHVEVWPGHVGGSLCGAAGVTGRISSTIGYERRANQGFGPDDECRFVDALVGRIPERPPTVEIVVSLNRRFEERVSPAASTLGPLELQSLVAEGALVVDGRAAEDFDAASIPGSLSVSLGELGLGSRAAWFVDPGEPIVVVGTNDDEAREVAARLMAVGLQNIKGILHRGLEAWQEARLPVVVQPRIDLVELASLLRKGAVRLVDVRDADEFELCHLPGSLHLPWRQIRRRSRELLPPGKPIVVACATGRRTPFAASALARRHDLRVIRLAEGGVAGLADHGIELAGSALPGGSRTETRPSAGPASRRRTVRRGPDARSRVRTEPPLDAVTTETPFRAVPGSGPGLSALGAESGPSGPTVLRRRVR